MDFMDKLCCKTTIEFGLFQLEKLQKVKRWTANEFGQAVVCIWGIMEAKKKLNLRVKADQVLFDKFKKGFLESNPTTEQIISVNKGINE